MILLDTENIPFNAELKYWIDRSYKILNYSGGGLKCPGDEYMSIEFQFGRWYFFRNDNYIPLDGTKDFYLL
jgi:hypothetical protein